MFLTNATLKSFAVAALGLALRAPALYSQSPNPPVSAVQFGMIGVGGGQTPRLSIIAYPPDPVRGTPPCIAQLGFANSSGGPVGPTSTVNLASGQGDFLDHPPNPFGGRAEVLPVVTMLPSAGGGTPACLASAEILDSFSGFSLVLAPGVIAWPPEPVFSATGSRLGAGAAAEYHRLAAQPDRTRLLRRAVELRRQIRRPGGTRAQGGESEPGACGLPGCRGREPGGAVRAAGGTPSRGHLTAGCGVGLRGDVGSL